MKKEIKKKIVKVKKAVKKEKVEKKIDVEEIKHTIGLLEIDLGRDDLNLMKDKINEIIKHVS